MRRELAVLAVIAVLGASCSADRERGGAEPDRPTPTRPAQTTTTSKPDPLVDRGKFPGLLDGTTWFPTWWEDAIPSQAGSPPDEQAFLNPMLTGLPVEHVQQARRVILGWLEAEGDIRDTRVDYIAVAKIPARHAPGPGEWALAQMGWHYTMSGWPPDSPYEEAFTKFLLRRTFEAPFWEIVTVS